jgi:hypothetical protein
MITSRFGSECTVKKAADIDGWAIFTRVEDGAQREWHISEMRADTAEEWDEIMGRAPGADECA